VTDVLVLGLGNVLLADDGVGVRAVAALERDFEPPPGVRILDGGTLGLALLGELAEARRIVLVDAVATGDPPGTLVRVDGDEVEPAVRGRLSPHQIGVADLLDALRLLDRIPESITLIGLTPATIELSTELSPAVASALPALIATVAAELFALGRPLVSLTPERAVIAPPSPADPVPRREWSAP
jgi:hydrogenase maturation protease